MPNVKHPDRFPEHIKLAVDNALKGEVILPFETPRLAKGFRAQIYDYCRAHREYKTDYSQKLLNVSVKFYTTHDVELVRPGYGPGPLYPYTVVLDFRVAYLNNVANMQVRKSDGLDPPTRSEVSPAHYVAPPLGDDLEYPSISEHDREAAFADILNTLDDCTP